MSETSRRNERTGEGLEGIEERANGRVVQVVFRGVRAREPAAARAMPIAALRCVWRACPGSPFTAQFLGESALSRPLTMLNSQKCPATVKPPAGWKCLLDRLYPVLPCALWCGFPPGITTASAIPDPRLLQPQHRPCPRSKTRGRWRLPPCGSLARFAGSRDDTARQPVRGRQGHAGLDHRRGHHPAYAQRWSCAPAKRWETFGLAQSEEGAWEWRRACPRGGGVSSARSRRLRDVGVRRAADRFRTAAALRCS